MKFKTSSIKLQIFFILLKIFNLGISYALFFGLRHLLMKLTGCRLDKRTVVYPVRFFSFGKVSIGANTVINRGCYLDNRRTIAIGRNVNISHDTKIYTLGHDIMDPSFATKGSGVVIDDNVVIFSNVLIMPGVHLGEGSVVLPGSVVTKNVLPYNVVGGNPAQFVKQRTGVFTYQLDYKYWFAH